MKQWYITTTPIGIQGFDAAGKVKLVWFRIHCVFLCFLFSYFKACVVQVMFERMKMEKEEGRERVHVGTRVSSESEQQRITAEVEPTTTVASQVTERREQEVAQADTDRLDEMRERLKKLNSYSSLLNVMSLMSLSWHLVYLAQRLHS